MDTLKHLYDPGNPDVFWSAITATAAVVALLGAVVRWVVLKRAKSDRTEQLIGELLTRLDHIARVLCETAEMTGRHLAAPADIARADREVAANVRRTMDATTGVLRLLEESGDELRKDRSAHRAAVHFKECVAPMLSEMDRHDAMAPALAQLHQGASRAGAELAKAIAMLRS